MRSLPDGVAQVLAEYLANSHLRDEEAEAEHEAEAGGNGNNMLTELALDASEDAETQRVASVQQIGDLCPECGQAAVVNEEGCRKCYACGFSEC